jgi:hypothetical protein
MPERPKIGDCEECHKRFEYELVHNGVHNSSYAYCDRCGQTAILDVADPRFPLDMLKQSAYRAIAAGMEKFLKHCDCGGSFTGAANPRCPHCKEELSPVKAAAYIERNAPKTAHDWRWQMNWTGNYCIVIEGRQVRNNFAGAAAAKS